MLFKRCRYMYLSALLSIIILCYYITHYDKESSSPVTTTGITTKMNDDLEEIELTDEDRELARDRAMLQSSRKRHGPFKAFINKAVAVRIDSIDRESKLNKSYSYMNSGYTFKPLVVPTTYRPPEYTQDLQNDKNYGLKTNKNPVRGNTRIQNQLPNIPEHPITSTISYSVRTKYFTQQKNDSQSGKVKDAKTIKYGKEITMERPDVLNSQKTQFHFPPLPLSDNITNPIIQHFVNRKTLTFKDHKNGIGYSYKESGTNFIVDKKQIEHSGAISSKYGKWDLRESKGKLPNDIKERRNDNNFINENANDENSRRFLDRIDIIIKPKLLTSKQMQQLNHIEAVKEELTYLHGLMQSDRLYNQYNKSKGKTISQTKFRVDSLKKFHDKSKMHLVMQVPPPSYGHGYPIEVRSANFIPSPDRLDPSKVIRDHDLQTEDNNDQGDYSSPNKYNDWSMENDGSNSGNSFVHNYIPMYDGFPKREMANIYSAFNSKITEDNEYSQVPDVAHSVLEQTMDFKPTVYDVSKDNFLSKSMDNNKQTNAILNEQRSKAELIQDTISLSVKDITTKPSTIQTDLIRKKELKYERLPNGDLTVYNLPNKSSVSLDENTVVNASQQLNKTNDSHWKQFIVKVSSSALGNDSVATVKKGLFSQPKRVTTIIEQWQVHGSMHKTFLYSAYYDDRPGLDRHKIRLISISNIESSTCFCLMWYNDASQPDIALAVFTKIGAKIQPDITSENKYEPNIITCAVRLGKGAPHKVSVITMDNHTVSTLLDVQIPIKPASPDDRINLGQCMSVVYWHKETEQLVEWLEANRMWGVGEITVYGNQLSPTTQDTFEFYRKEGYVDFRQMPNIIDDSSEFTILLNMSPAINDCMYRNMYRYKRIICTDVDELLVPRQAMNYSTMIDQILQQSKNSHPHPAFMFRNIYFFTDFGPVTEEPWFLRSMRYLKHIKPSEFGYSVKSITDPQSCIALQNHLCWKRMKIYEGRNWSIDVPVKLGRLQHYKKCHFDSYLRQVGACKRLMKDYYVDKNIKRFQTILYHKAAHKLVELKIATPA